MEGAWPGLRVPLRVEVKQGASWGELREVPREGTCTVAGARMTASVSEREGV